MNETINESVKEEKPEKQTSEILLLEQPPKNTSQQLDENGRNPFKSESPELISCFKENLGEKLFQTFANHQRPLNDEERMLIEDCVKQFEKHYLDKEQQPLKDGMGNETKQKTR